MSQTQNTVHGIGVDMKKEKEETKAIIFFT